MGLQPLRGHDGRYVHLFRLWRLILRACEQQFLRSIASSRAVSPEYFCNLDMSGRRVDFDSRPELSRGTCDFRVPREYWAVQASPPASVLLPVAPASSHADTARLSPRPDADGPHSNGSTLGMTGAGGAAAKAATKAASDAMSAVSIGMGRTTVRAPRPMTYLFAIDVSFSAIRCGALQTSVEAIRETIYGPKQEEGEGANGESEKVEKEGEEVNGPGFGLPHGSRIAILTFDRALHFYNLSVSGCLRERCVLTSIVLSLY